MYIRFYNKNIYDRIKNLHSSSMQQHCTSIVYALANVQIVCIHVYIAKRKNSIRKAYDCTVPFN